MRKTIFWILILFLLPLTTWAQSYEGIALRKAPIDLNNKPSLQRGAKIFINYCSGCHSLNFMRYNRLARDIGIVDKNGNIEKTLLKDNLIFTGAGIADTIQVAMPKKDAQSWFGVAPPDLSLIARSRGVDWLYTYLLSFYEDSARPFGVNNLLFNETAMPDVLVNLRGEIVPVYGTKIVGVNGDRQSIRVVDHLVMQKPGTMTAQQFDVAMADLVNFLAYVGEPAKQDREHTGYWVLGFLLIFAVFAYLLKRKYWKDIYK